MAVEHEGGRGARPDRRVARSRRALKEALTDLILERGYEAVTVQDVIDRADVGRSTFYAHFLDKDDLLDLILDEAYGQIPLPPRSRSDWRKQLKMIWTVCTFGYSIAFKASSTRSTLTP